MARVQRLVLAAVGFVLGFHPISEGDTFWHLTLGRAVLRHGSRTVPEPTALLDWTTPCPVPEWLWGVFTFGVQSAFGVRGLSLVTPVFGALIGVSVSLLLERLMPRRAGLASLALGIAAMCVVADQLSVRPNLAFLVILPLFLRLALVYREQDPARGVRTGLGMVLTTLLWAQVHGSFVLAPALFAIVVVPTRITQRAWVRLDGLIVLGFLCAALTCAHGVAVADFIVSHSGGDATKHIMDMKPFDWARVAPFGWPIGAVLTAFLFAGALGVLVAGRVDVSFLLLAMLGGLMTHTATRFVVEWVVLLLPLSAAGVEALLLHHASRPRLRRAVEVSCLVYACVLLVWTAEVVEASKGPLFRTGVRANIEVLATTRFLERLPAGSPVFTEYSVGGPLGFRSDGKARTYVDGRTPLYFDAADWGIARELYMSGPALGVAIRRYGFRAAVVERDMPTCRELAQHWKPVVIEPKYTTFVPKDDPTPALSGFAPCGPFYLTVDACDGAAEPARGSLKTLRALGSSPFNDFLEGAIASQCRRDTALGLAALPAQQDGYAFASELALHKAILQFRLKQYDAAFSTIEGALSAGEVLPVRAVLEPRLESLDLERAHAVLNRGVTMMDDNAPAALRARLALTCGALGDVECARHQGVRAAMNGATEAIPAVHHASKKHPDARVRRDLERWLATWTQRAP